MATGRERAAWNHTSHILAAMLNGNPFASRIWLASELNPYLRPADDEAADDDEDGNTISAMDLAYILCGQQAIDEFARADAAAK